MESLHKSSWKFVQGHIFLLRASSKCLNKGNIRILNSAMIPQVCVVYLNDTLRNAIYSYNPGNIISIIDPAFRLITIRAKITKNRQARVVPYSESTGVLYANYLRHRKTLSREKSGIFLSESKRNKGSPIG